MALQRSQSDAVAESTRADDGSSVAVPDRPTRRPGQLIGRIVSRLDFVILGSLILGIAVRASSFGQYPPGLHQDELSSAYDAFALWHDGIDRNGFHNPVAFVAFGCGMSAVATYSMMPFIGMLGATTVALRLPFLLAGSASILLLACLAREIQGIQTARVVTFLMAICPWHVVMSRWGHEANLVPLVLLAGTLVAVLALKRPWLLPLAFAILGMDLYTYGPAYVVLPVYLALLTPYMVYHGRWQFKPLLVAMIVLGIVSLPATVYALVNVCGWDSIVTPWFSIPHLPGTPRYETVGNFRFWEPQFLHSVASNMLTGAQILLSQDDGQIWHAVPGYGLMYLFGMPFALWGFALLCRECFRREFTPAYFMLAWCITTAVQALFIRPNILRFSLGLVPLVYCTALAVLYFRDDRQRWGYYGILAAFALGFVAFTWNYFTKYAVAVGPRAMFTEAIQSASRDPQAQVCVTELIGFSSIYVLWANQEDPREFLRTVEYVNPGGEFQTASSFGRYTFGLPEHDRPEVDVYIAFEGQGWFTRDEFEPEEFGRFVVWRRKR